MACLRFTLHGSYDVETEQARKVLDNSEIPYRLERPPKEDYDGQVVLVTPAGRFCGLETITFMFGK